MPTIEDLTAQFHAAQAAAEAYSTAVTEKYRDQLPSPVDAVGKPLPAPDELLVARARAWTEDERTELERLRKAATEAAVQLHRARQAGGDDAPRHVE